VRTILIAWAISAVLLILIAVSLGILVKRRFPLATAPFLGILIDNRGRYSLTQLQVVLWTIVVLSLVSGVFWGRLMADAKTALDFAIPDVLLAVLGISLGSAASALAVKSSKDNDPNTSETVPVADENHPPRFSQVFLLEQGAMADKVVDITKFQNFWITLILVVAYVALAIATIRDVSSATELRSLPTFDARFVTLLGISHAGYLAGKLPNPSGEPESQTIAQRNQAVRAVRTIHGADSSS
jgi:hypothetical protein